MRMLVALILLVGCSTGRSHDSRVASASEPAGEALRESSTAQPVDAAAKSRAWIDPDALPDGAVRRFGSKRFDAGAPLALLANGWVVSSGERVEVCRSDGMIRNIGDDAVVAALDDDRIVLAGGGTVRIVDHRGAVVSKFAAPKCQVAAALFSADGSLIGCGGDQPIFYDTQTGKVVFQSPVKDVYSRAGGVSLRSTTVAFLAGDPAYLYVYDLHTKRRVRRSKARDVESVALSRDGAGLYIIERDGALRREVAATGKRQWRHKPARTTFSFPLLPTRDDRIIAVGLYVPGSDAEDGMHVGLFDTKTRELRDLGPAYTSGLDFSPDETRLAVSASQGLYVFDVNTGERLMGPSASYENIAKAALSGDMVAAVTDNGLIRMWNRNTGKPLIPERRLVSDDGSMYAEDIVFLDATSLAVAARYSGAFIVDATTGQTRCTAVDAHAHQLIPLGDDEHFAALYRGVAPDDWPYAGQVAIVDRRCKINKIYQYQGALFDGTATPSGALRLTVLNGSEDVEPTHLWHEDIEPKHWRKQRVAGSRRLLGDNSDLARTLTEFGVTVDSDGQVFLQLSDGQTIKFNQTPYVMRAPGGRVAVLAFSDQRGYQGLVVEHNPRTIRRRIRIPERGFQFRRATIDVAGRWLALIEDNTLLLYDLGDSSRGKKRKP